MAFMSWDAPLLAHRDDVTMESRVKTEGYVQDCLHIDAMVKMFLLCVWFTQGVSVPLPLSNPQALAAPLGNSIPCHSVASASKPRESPGRDHDFLDATL